MGRTLGALFLTVVCGCGGSPAGTTVDGPGADASPIARCTTGQPAKIRFAQETGCANDGSIEFCIPDRNPSVASAVTAISSGITCAVGGGRAGCLATPGQLLCTYPTAVPTECVTQHGAMTSDTWSNVCALSSVPEIAEIVPTFFE